MASIKLKGDTSGEVTIQAPAVAGTTTLNLPATSSTLATQNALGVRNLIINGDMKIAQRGTSATGKTTSGYYTCDRWYNVFGSAGTWTFTQDTDVPSGQGFVNSLKLDCTTANASLSTTASFQLHQRLEGQMLQHLKKGSSSAESVTLSFWVKSNKTGTYQFNLRDMDNTRMIAKTYTINTADTWENKTLTFAGDTTGVFDNDNNNSLRLEWWLAAGSNYTTGSVPTSWEATDTTDLAAGLTVNLADSTSNYINITGVQLEVGDTATPFEHRPYDMELARCQRYYYTSYSEEARVGSGTIYGIQLETPSFNGNHVATYTFPVKMRATPNLIGYTDSGTAGSFTTSAGSITAQFFGTKQTGTSPFAFFNGNWHRINLTADAEL